MSDKETQFFRDYLKPLEFLLIGFKSQVLLKVLWEIIVFLQ